MKELAAYMKDEDIKSLSLNVLPDVKRFLKAEEYPVSTVIRFKGDVSPVYIILHFNTDSQFIR